MTDAHYPHDRVQSIDSLQHPLGMASADLKRLAARASKMYFIAKRVPKDDGSLRILYDTQEPLKSVLHRINANFLRKVVYPDYLTGGVPGKDYTNSAMIHLGARSVIKEDISKFYPSVRYDVVHEIWAKFFGFADEVADLLALLTTRDEHLEQGAPTSGYLANLALWDVEPRLIAALAPIGITRYSRHVDDITLSSVEHLSSSKVDWAVRTVGASLALKGLLVHPTKHEVMQAAGPIKILKLVANTKPSLPLQERSRVRAMVHSYCQQVAMGGSVPELLALLPRVRGQAYKVKRFHQRIGERMVEQLKQAADQLKSSAAERLHPVDGI